MSAPNDIGLYFNFHNRWDNNVIVTFLDDVPVTTHDTVIEVPQTGTIDVEFYWASLASFGTPDIAEFYVQVYADLSAGVTTTYGPSTLNPWVTGVPGNTHTISGVAVVAGDRLAFNLITPTPPLSNDPGDVAGYVLLTYV
jgi:hypothetical protein